ncbi:MAG: histidine phosphatase family protein [Methanococcaceae archaeon]
MITFLLIRHGDTMAGNTVPGRKPGVHLSSNGLKQAAQIAELLKDVPIKHICCSPLDRTLETAGPISESHGLVLEINPGLLEIDFGDWTGKSFQELESIYEWKLFHIFRSGTRIPNGEMMIEIQQRMVTEIEKLRERFKSGIIAVVSHGDPIKTLIAHYAGIPLDYVLRVRIDTASVSVIKIDDFGAELRCLNFSDHLPPLE